MIKSKLNIVAYYLGQFHPTPENDVFWGAGFTEWHNVAKARPLYPGHVQPKLPGHFGFYDLRCIDTLAQQIDYSHRIGVTAFCYWHYWFAGKRILHGPLDAMLKLNHDNFKFMLGWANETWSGVWHGERSRVLIEQTYNRGELHDHARLISDYIRTGHYLEIDGRFPFVIYKPRLIPGGKHYLNELKQLVKEFSGSEIYMIGNWAPGRSGEFRVPSDYGLDAAVITPVAAYFKNPLIKAVYAGIAQGLRKSGVGPELGRYNRTATTLQRAREDIHGISHATIVTGWDNTPRSGRRGLVLLGYNKEAFVKASTHALALEKQNTPSLLFVKSWNEWAEGNMLEPLYNENWSAGETLKEALCGV